jgi:RNA polymerase sigma-70 factor, ECF subfamily
LSANYWDDYEDAELVIETLVGNVAAFDSLVRRYRAAVLATVLRQVGSRPVAEDICQEAFVRAFRALVHLREPERFPAWLHAIARREVIRHAPGEARAADHAPLDGPALEQGVGQGPSSWEALERQEEDDAVRRAMASLPEEFQLVLTLRYWAEMPLEQIAAYLGRPLTTIKWRLHRARLLMRQQLLPAVEAERIARPPDRPSAPRTGRRGESTETSPSRGAWTPPAPPMNQAVKSGSAAAHP